MLRRLTQRHLDQFERDGFVLIQGVFSREEVTALRRGAEKVRDAEKRRGNSRLEPACPELFFCWGDLLGKPPLDSLIFDRRVVDIVKDLLGDEVVYWGDSNFQMGQGCRGLHKDSVDRNNADGEDWKSRYNVIRGAVYAQDHVQHSGGVKFRKGSHRFWDCERGRLYDLPSEAGDLAFWKLTTTHSGNVARNRLLKSLPLQVRFENRLPGFLKAPEAEERLGLFFTYGAPGKHLDRYIQWCIQRGDYAEHWRTSRGDAHATELLRRAGVEFRRPIPDYGSRWEAPLGSPSAPHPKSARDAAPSP